MSAPIVWFEVLGQHGDNLQDFYAEVLGWSFDTKPPPPPVRAGAARSAARGALAVRRAGEAATRPGG